jgi:hypothetical protein
LTDMYNEGFNDGLKVDSSIPVIKPVEP